MFCVGILDVFRVIQTLGQKASLPLGEIGIDLLQGGADVRRAHRSRAEFDLARSVRGQGFVKLKSSSGEPNSATTAGS